MLACEICSRTSDRDREIENLREDREAILTIDARESKGNPAVMPWESRCAANPPLWAGSEMQQPILGLYTAPPRLELVVWACLGPPWPSLPAASRPCFGID